MADLTREEIEALMATANVEWADGSTGWDGSTALSRNASRLAATALAAMKERDTLAAKLAEAERERAVITDLLETQYRATDAARLESEKADDEALRLKTENTSLKIGIMKNEEAIVYQWKDRAERAEARLAKALKALEKAEKWTESGHIRLHAGEMTAQEMRTAKAVATAIVGIFRRAIVEDAK